MYGGWITDKGEILEVADKMKHNEVVNYKDAREGGYIAFTYASGCYYFDEDMNKDMSFRFEPLDVSNHAIKTAIKLISRSKESRVYLSDTGLTDFDGYSQGLTKAEAKHVFRNLLRDRNFLYNHRPRYKNNQQQR